MDLDAFVRMILRRGWLALALAVLGILAGLAVGFVQSPVYEATTRIALAPARPADLGQNQAVREIMPSYIEDLKTHDMADEAATQLGEAFLTTHRLTPDDLFNMIRIDADANVFEIHVKARNADPAIAGQVSEKWAIAFTLRRTKTNERLDLRERIYATLRDRTEVAQAAPRRKLLLGVGALLGGLLGGGLILVWEFLSRAVVLTAEDASRVVGTPAIGVIPGGARRRASGLAAGVADAWTAVRAGAGQLWPVALLAAVGLATGLALTVAQPTVWRARTKIAIEPALGTDWGRTQAIPEFMKNLAEDLRTWRMAETINADLGLDLPPERLLEKVTVAPKESVFEVHLDVLDPDRDTAIQISRAWAERFVETRNQANLNLDQQDRVLVRLRDRTLSERYSPKPLANTSAGVVIGALIGALLVALRALGRAGTIQDGREAGRSAASPLLGVIPRRRRRPSIDRTGVPR